MEGSFREKPELGTFWYVRDLVEDSQGNIYVSENNSPRYKIRRISPSGWVTTFAGGPEGYADGTGTAAQFKRPEGLAVDDNDNIYVADSGNYCIRKITPQGVVTTYAGTGSYGEDDGSRLEATFRSPQALAFADDGTLYVGDGILLRTISVDGTVTTISDDLSGHMDGAVASARFNEITGLAFDSDGALYIADSYNNAIRKLYNGTVSTVAGGSYGYADGTGTAAQFRYPADLAFDGSGDLLVTDSSNHMIRKVTTAGVVTTVAGISAGVKDGALAEALFNTPRGIIVRDDDTVMVADYINTSIRAIADGEVTTYASERQDGSVDGLICELAPDYYTYTFCRGSGDDLFMVSGTTGYTDIKLLKIDGSGDYSVFAELGSLMPSDMVYNSSTDEILFSERSEDRIYKIDNAGSISLLAGSDQGDAEGTGSAAQFYDPDEIALGSDNSLYVADDNNDKIRKVSSAGEVTDYFGPSFRPGGSYSYTLSPTGVAVDSAGILYVGDFFQDKIVTVSPDDPQVVAYLQDADTGYAADFDRISMILLDDDDTLYVLDDSKYVIKISPNNTVDTIYTSSYTCSDIAWGSDGDLLLLSNYGIQPLTVHN